ncbi:MAG: helix-turn-helix transcriptional regulator [Verrucomicrobia bacterium]|nr:helix-turn-helix transcriptional regulator [Verrucomicrobiota bacterium]
MASRIEKSFWNRASRWSRPASLKLDLWYLGWGRRFYGKQPRIPMSHPTWRYYLVKKGHPTFVETHRRFILNPGELLIAHPDFASGWTDQTMAACEVFVWMWETPPRCPECRPKEGACLRLMTDPASPREIENVHEACRKEVNVPDHLSPHAIESLRLRLDVAIARSFHPPGRTSSSSLQLQLAVGWMQNNLAVVSCVPLICDYLQISPGRLYRLFLEHAGKSPLLYFRQLKMEAAREMLRKERKSVKEVAFSLGYRFPNDFSRAYKSVMGRSPHLVARVS